MVDRVTPARRSAIMSKVGTKDTGPELTVRSALHRLGYRFRLHRRDLPGRPDLVFSSRLKVVFVHGCYWHGHACRWGKLPKSKLDYWGPKIAANRQRDERRLDELAALGWKAHVVWQCELRQLDDVIARLIRFLDDG